MGASSFHLLWEFGRRDRDARLVEASAVLEVVVPPSVPLLYFWALQVDFVDDRGVWGGAHTGLQWNPRYPGGTAVNWGGYASVERGGVVLDGSRSPLPGFDDDPNTLAYGWLPGRPYRLRVYRSPETAGAWRADVTDIEEGRTVVIRDLHPWRPRRRSLLRNLFTWGDRPESDGTQANYLARPVVWSEVFAPCDAASVTVRWSELEAVDERGSIISPEAVVVNYQPEAEGGCLNTNAMVGSGGGLLQVTSTPRVVNQGKKLPL